MNLKVPKIFCTKVNDTVDKEHNCLYCSQSQIQYKHSKLLEFKCSVMGDLL